MSSVAELEKRVRGLNKKLAGIDELEKKAKSSKMKLDKDQQEKLKRRPAIVKEIDEIKKKIAEVHASGEEPQANGSSEHAEDSSNAAPAPTTKAEAKAKAEAAAAEQKKEEAEEENLRAEEAIASHFHAELRKLEKRIRGIEDLKKKPKAELDAAQKEKVNGLVKDKEKLAKVRREQQKAVEDYRKAREEELKAAEQKDEEEEEEEEDQVDRTKLMALYKELEIAQDLRRRIALKKLKNPNLVQKNKAEMVETLQAAVAKEEKRIQEEEALHAPELSETEKRIKELEEEKKLAVENEQYDEAKRLKAVIERLKAGGPEEEAPQEAPPAKDEAEVEAEAPEEEPEEPKEPEETEEEREAREKAEEEERRRAEEEAERKAKEEAEALKKRKELEARQAKEQKERGKFEAEENSVRDSLEKEEQEAWAKVWRKRPKTEAELMAGIKLVPAKKKGDNDQNGEYDDTDLPDISFDELMLSAQKRRKAQATEPYSIVLDSVPPATRKAAGNVARDGILAKQASKRLMMDLHDLSECPLYTVRAEPAHDDLFTWHANVSPIEGPYAGFVIHFIIYFPDAYPLEPPVVRCCTPISHECIVDTPRFTSEVCLHVNDRSDPKRENQYAGWCPAYTARTILSHLATIFDASYFKKKKGAKEQKPGNPKPASPKPGSPKNQEAKLDEDKLAVLTFSCKDTGHCMENPFPAIPCFNGPFTKDLPAELVLQQGCMWAASAAGHRWMHGYSKMGRHYFRCVLRHRGEETPSWKVGWAAPDAVLTADCEQGWFFDPVKGELIHDKEVTKVDATANAGDVIDCWLDLDKEEVSFCVNGTQIEHKLTGISKDAVYHPSFFFSKDSGAELIFVPNVAALEPSSLPIASVSSVIDNVPCCSVTKEDVNDAVLGVGLSVERSGVTVKSITGESDLISQEAFSRGNVRKTLRESKPLHTFFPLLLGPHHGAKTRPILERSIAEILRNPRATLPGYTPPFKAGNVNIVMPMLLQGVVRTLVPRMKEALLRDYDIQKAISMYSHFVHAYKTLAEVHSSVVEDAEKLLAKLSEGEEDLTNNTKGLCMPISTMNIDNIFKEILLDTIDAADSLDEAYSEKRVQLQSILLLHALNKLFVTVTREELTTHHGRPTPDQVESFRKTCRAMASTASFTEAAAVANCPFTAEELEKFLDE